ncbi:MAG: zinc ribbon domain-containing protein [Candidatus Krumholzibacteria bacterium]|nr:zinc ribbon domain-containing protein [Candidatus Krumholzibacteria bacterium]
MPIFEFECGKCGNRFEELVPSSCQEVECPACGSLDTRKQISPFSSMSGWKSGGSGCSSGGG